MWPSLPKVASDAFIRWASKDEQRLEHQRAALPTRGTYSGSAEMTEWVEGSSKWGGCYEIIAKSYKDLLHFPGEYYNVFYHLQVRAWEQANPLIKQDFNRAKDVLYAMRTARSPLDESKFMKWVDSFRLLGQLKPFHILGEVEERKAKPSILLAVRL